MIWGGAALVLALVAWRWRPLLLATLSEDLAAAAGVDPRRERLILTLALALLVAVALKVVGALLVTAMLIVPAAAARSVARTPEAMAVGAVAAGAAAALAGLAGSGSARHAGRPVDRGRRAGPAGRRERGWAAERVPALTGRRR